MSLYGQCKVFNINNIYDVYIYGCFIHLGLERDERNL